MTHHIVNSLIIILLSYHDNLFTSIIKLMKENNKFYKEKVIIISYKLILITFLDLITSYKCFIILSFMFFIHILDTFTTYHVFFVSVVFIY